MKRIIVCGFMSLVSMNSLASQAKSDNCSALFEVSKRETQQEFDVLDKGELCIFPGGIYLDRTPMRRVLSAHDCKELNEALTENPTVRINVNSNNGVQKASYIVPMVRFGLNRYKTGESVGRRAEYLANLRITPEVRQKIKEKSSEIVSIRLTPSTP